MAWPHRKGIFVKVLAALSGGVDSAVAAARAVEAGHDVTAVHMALSTSSAQSRCGSRGCCTIEDKTDAARAAEMLGIPFYVWDMADTFEKTVIEDFLQEYRAGRTPNPCVRCNEFVKFRELLHRGMMLGFDAVATGHYARLETAADGGVELHRARCYDKDQSYVLAVMGRDALEHVLFPLGDVHSKADVRAEASRRGLPMSAKPDSYDICFIADGDTQGFLRSRLGDEPGDIVDDQGNVVGRHQGAYAYTVGQRKGLRLGRPAADGRPRYVLNTDMATNTVVVGAKELLSVNRIEAEDAIVLAPGHEGLNGGEVSVQYRAHGQEVAARVWVEGDAMRIELLEMTRAVAAGQSLVVYDGTRVLGQATISRAYRER